MVRNTDYIIGIYYTKNSPIEYTIVTCDLPLGKTYDKLLRRCIMFSHHWECRDNVFWGITRLDETFGEKIEFSKLPKSIQDFMKPRLETRETNETSTKEIIEIDNAKGETKAMKNTKTVKRNNAAKKNNAVKKEDVVIKEKNVNNTKIENNNARLNKDNDRVMTYAYIEPKQNYSRRGYPKNVYIAVNHECKVYNKVETMYGDTSSNMVFEIKSKHMINKLIKRLDILGYKMC